LAARRTTRTPTDRGVVPARLQQFVGGRWCDSAGGREYDSLSPWDGSVVASASAGDADDARLAVEAAHDAFAGWAASLPGDRQQVFLRVADSLLGQRQDIVAALALETGCGAHFANVQVDFAVSLMRQVAGLAYAPSGQVIPSDVPGTQAVAMRRPVGVVAAIAPWNASLILSGRAIAGPLALGNTVVLKPSEESPFTGGVLWGQLFEAAGLPAGVLNVVTHAPGDAGAIGDELIANPLVRRVNFTGSTATGRRLAEAAGRNLKRVVLQLSGQNPLIVLADVDVQYAVEAACYGAFVHQGQVCMCVRRIFVERPIAAEFMARFAERVGTLAMGDPREPDTVIGPLISRWALTMITRRVDEAVALGARVLAGGVAQPPCFPATILTDVPPEAELSFDETFGPVVIVDVVEDAAEAVRLTNESRFGLSAGVLAGSVEHGMAVARQLDAGIVHVNDQTVNDEPQMPFGGMKDSGWGRFGVGFAVEEFCDLQWVTSRSTPRSYPF
jgi:acyl-CoA reductase-like NAD-dependent aldehyde dehydrogenase